MTDQPANPTTYQDSPQSPPEACHEVFSPESDHFTIAIPSSSPLKAVEIIQSTRKARGNHRTAFKNGHKPLNRGPTCLMQLTDIQATIYQTLMLEKLTAAERAALARALCEVDKRIRVWRGLPDPGVFRPDLDPVKNAKMLRGKRGKGSPVLDLPAAQAFSEAVEKVKAEARAAGAQLDSSLESESDHEGSSAAPEGNPPESKTRATPATKPATKPAGKVK